MNEPFTITKYGYVVPISCCLAETCEPGAHPAPPKLPWRRRVQLRINYWWYDNRIRVHRGPCPDGDDYL